MGISLSIGGFPICGAVGVGARLIISTEDCWSAYHKFVTSLAEKDAPLCVLRNAQWEVNGAAIEEPKAWFLVLDDVPNEQN